VKKHHDKLQGYAPAPAPPIIMASPKCKAHRTEKKPRTIQIELRYIVHAHANPVRENGNGKKERGRGREPNLDNHRGTRQTDLKKGTIDAQ
jgi:hypothetical protein